MISCRSSRSHPSAPSHEIPPEKHRFSRPKTSPYISDIASAFRRRNTRRNRVKTGASVTTSHVFWPNQRRRTTSLLPIWLRNSDIIGRQYDQEAERGGRGDQRNAAAKMP